MLLGVSKDLLDYALHSTFLLTALSRVADRDTAGGPYVFLYAGSQTPDAVQAAGNNAFQGVAIRSAVCLFSIQPIMVL